MRRSAFTLVELLVVVTIIAIGALLLVPAFGRISASINYTGAVNSVTATLGAARTIHGFPSAQATCIRSRASPGPCCWPALRW